MPQFATETFRRNDAPIDAPINPLMKFTTPPYFDHWHAVVYQGNTALADYARQALRETGKPVYAAKKDSKHYRLPENEGPENGSVFVVRDGTIFIRLDRLPYDYFPLVAQESGLGYSPEFALSHGQLAYYLADFGHDFGLDCREERSFVNSPDPITAAKQFVFPDADEPVIKSLLRFGFQRAGLWTGDLERLSYSDKSGIVYTDRDFDHSAMVAVINEAGGWIDFDVHGVYGRAVLNITVTGKDERGMTTAVVQQADFYGRRPDRNQKRFMNAVFDTFGVS